MPQITLVSTFSDFVNLGYSEGGKPAWSCFIARAENPKTKPFILSFLSAETELKMTFQNTLLSSLRYFLQLEELVLFLQSNSRLGICFIFPYLSISIEIGFTIWQSLKN